MLCMVHGWVRVVVHGRVRAVVHVMVRAVVHVWVLAVVHGRGGFVLWCIRGCVLWCMGGCVLGNFMSSGAISENNPTSPSPLLMKFYQLLQLPFKLGSIKFQLQIINGCCTIITNEEVTAVAAWFFTTNSQSLKFFPAKPDKLEA